jgi:DNA ligase-1
MPLSRRHLLARLCGLAAVLPGARADALAPPVLLAHNAPPQVDPAPYLVSEKYDGVRALWDGRTLRFRSGRLVPAPGWFTAALPATPLDGELWLARGRFDELSGVVRRREPVDAQWREVHYMLFELPQAAVPFAERAERLRRIVATVPNAALHAVMQRRVPDRRALQRLFDDVVRGGGEGLMLHRADAAYVTGRSDALLKLKPLADAEAVVVARLPGHGKYAGMMGALLLQTPSGLRFKLGTGFSDAERAAPPAIGSTVTYAYRSLTPQGVPRFASFIRVCDDI